MLLWKGIIQLQVYRDELQIEQQFWGRETAATWSGCKSWWDHKSCRLLPLFFFLEADYCINENKHWVQQRVCTQSTGSDILTFCSIFEIMDLNSHDLFSGSSVRWKNGICMLWLAWQIRCSKGSRFAASQQEERVAEVLCMFVRILADYLKCAWKLYQAELTLSFMQLKEWEFLQGEMVLESC